MADGLLAGILRAAAGYVGPAIGSLATASTPKQISMYYDPIDVISGLALIALHTKNEKKGIKLSLKDNRVSLDLPSFYQGIKRAYEGTHHEQLADLTNPIYCAIQWLKPKENDQYKIIFELALEGVQSLMETYKSDRMVADFLHNVTARVLRDGLDYEKEMNPDEYGITEWSGNLLANESKRIWGVGESEEKVKKITELFRVVLKKDSLELEEGFPFDSHAESIASFLDSTLQELTEYKKNLASTGEETVRKKSPSLELMTAGGGGSGGGALKSIGSEKSEELL